MSTCWLPSAKLGLLLLLVMIVMVQNVVAGDLRLHGSNSSITWDDIQLRRTSAGVVSLTGDMQVSSDGVSGSVATAISTVAALQATVATLESTVAQLSASLSQVSTAVCVKSWDVCPSPLSRVEYRLPESADANFATFFSDGSGMDVDGDSFVACQRNTNAGPGACIVATTVDDGATWQHEATLEPPPGSAIGIQFGVRASMDSDHVIVGAPYYPTGQGGSDDIGIGYIYKRSASTWALQTVLDPPGRAHNDRLGIHPPCIRGSVAVISGWNHQYLYELDPADDDWKLAHTFNGRADNSQCGDDYVVLANRGVDGRVYTKVSGSWTLLQTVDFSVNPFLGWFAAVSDNGNYLIFSSPDDHVQIYERKGSGATTWELTLDQAGAHDVSGNHLGNNVGITDDGWAMIGARNDNTFATNAGAVYLYYRDPASGIWSPKDKWAHTNPVAEDQLAYGYRGVKMTKDYIIARLFYQSEMVIWPRR